MAIVQLPGVGVRGDVERAALRRGLATGSPSPLVQLLPIGSAVAAAYCAACARPIEFGTVGRGGQTCCSLACSLGGDHTA